MKKEYVFNTREAHYSRSLQRYIGPDEFAGYVWNAAKRNDVGVDLYVVMANFINLYGAGAVYLDLLSSGSDIPLSAVMPESHRYKNQTMRRSAFLEACLIIERLDVKFESESDVTRLMGYLSEQESVDPTV